MPRWVESARLHTLEQELRDLREELARATDRIAELERRPEQKPRSTGRETEDPAKRRNHQLRALKARCYRRALSDRERRKALDHIYALGALPADFDETELPWTSTQLLLDPNADPVRSDRIPTGVAGIVRFEDNLVMNFWLMARIARMSREWSRFEADILGAWEHLRERTGDPEAPLNYPSYGTAATVERSLFPDWSTAVDGQDLFYVGGAPLHRDGHWYALEDGYRAPRVVFVPEQQELEDSELVKLAQRRSWSRTELALARMHRFRPEVKALALVEIAFGAS